MYYTLEHNIDKDDIHIPIEYDDGLNSISEGKKLRVDKIYFKGKNESDMISLTGPVISEKAKDFFSSLDLAYISFIPHPFYHESNDKEIKYYLMKINNEIDCVDYEKSDLLIIGNRIRRIKKLIFKDSFQELKPIIFYIKGSGRFFVNEVMKNKINLKGFRFKSINKM